jgi:hypothetical protein
MNNTSGNVPAAGSVEVVLSVVVAGGVVAVVGVFMVKVTMASPIFPDSSIATIMMV